MKISDSLCSLASGCIKQQTPTPTQPHITYKYFISEPELQFLENQTETELKWETHSAHSYSPTQQWVVTS